jgi:hypothetical protein
MAALGYGGLVAAPGAHACPNNSKKTQENTTTYLAGDENAGGVYASGNPVTSPPSGTNGYIGASGSSPAGAGYVEAGGDATNPAGGYVVAADGTGTGNGIVSGTPGPC